MAVGDFLRDSAGLGGIVIRIDGDRARVAWSNGYATWVEFEDDFQN